MSSYRDEVKEGAAFLFNNHKTNHIRASLAFLNPVKRAVPLTICRMSSILSWESSWSSWERALRSREETGAVCAFLYTLIAPVTSQNSSNHVTLKCWWLLFAPEAADQGLSGPPPEDSSPPSSARCSYQSPKEKWVDVWFPRVLYRKAFHQQSEFINRGYQYFYILCFFTGFWLNCRVMS